jgi:hypothetical protein
MDDVGDVGRGSAGRQVRRGAQVDDCARCRDRFRGQACFLKHLLRLAIELQARQHLLVADAAARILVHDLDQVDDVLDAVADHVTRRAARGRDEFAVYDQQAVVIAFEVRLDDHRPGLFLRDAESLHDFVFRRELDRNATAVIAVVRLGDHGVADAPRGAGCLAFGLHQFLLRHGQAQCREDLVGFFLVAREFDRDVRRAAGDGRLDALLVAAVSELHQRLVIQAQPGDVAGFGRTHERRRRRSQRAALREANEFVARFGPVPAFGHAFGRADCVGQQRAKQPEREFAGGDALVTLRVFIDDRVDARCAGAARLAERDVLARDVLQFDRDVLEHVAEPGAFVFAHAAEKAARLAIRAAVFGEAREGGGKPVDERAAEAARGPVLEFTQVEFEPDDGEMCVKRRPDVYGPIQDAHSRLPPCL